MNHTLIAFLICFIGLHSIHSLKAQSSHERFQDQALIPVMINHSHPEDREIFSPDDDIEVVWTINPEHPLFKGKAKVYAIEVARIKLLACLKLGSPNQIALLNEGNKHNVISTRFSVRDFEYLLPGEHVAEYGNQWKPETKMYLYFEGMKVILEDGTVLEEPITGQKERYIGFMLK